jgi:Protein of unknown function (Hypoth_ymh)
LAVPLATELERYYAGFFGTFRNPIAHAARIEWPMSEQDALDLLSLASYILRRLKNGTVR